MKSLLEIVVSNTDSFSRGIHLSVLNEVESSLFGAVETPGDNECDIVVRFAKENGECYVQVLESFMKNEQHKKVNAEEVKPVRRGPRRTTTPKKHTVNKKIFEGMVPVVRHARVILESKGGATFTFRLDYKNSKVYFGIALCSMKDNFNKKIGREMADLYLHLFADNFELNREKMETMSLVEQLNEYLSNKEEQSEFEKKVLSFIFDYCEF